MALISRANVSQMTLEEISQHLANLEKVNESFLKERGMVTDEIMQNNLDLKATEKILEKQHSRLDRLKFFIDNEIEQREQLETASKQNPKQTILREKLQNSRELLGKYKSEEEIIMKENFETLESVRTLNKLILAQLDKLKELDSKIGNKRKNITLLKQGQNKLKMAM
eukprot:Seg2346.7 transcript_id=Seg2346.7/GoldUCD/mRNA.D3Y31 product="hypothetical protein" protein_id=Seg2346.7/GoldUCD/D3Y31